MKTNMKATLTQDSVLCVAQLLANSPHSAAVMTWQANMPAAPTSKSLRRPTASMVHRLVTMPTSCIMLRTPDMISCMS